MELRSHGLEDIVLVNHRYRVNASIRQRREEALKAGL